MKHLILAHKKETPNSRIAVINETEIDNEQNSLLSVKNFWKVNEENFVVDKIITVSPEELLNIIHNTELDIDSSLIKFKCVKSFYNYINTKFKD